MDINKIDNALAIVEMFGSRVMKPQPILSHHITVLFNGLSTVFIDFLLSVLKVVKKAI